MALKKTRRKYDRIKETVLLDIYKPDAFKPTCRACLTDISVGGAGFESSVKFNLNDKINLVFTMSSGKEYILEGVIRRVSRSTGTFSYGVEFLSVGFFKKFFIKRFIKKLLNSA
ncbi:MAG: PilZ domain-containing protein [Elusimicrobia bacterium]|nr:PilZ domain-containing protein [Elusimicrobiota bacterium]